MDLASPGRMCRECVGVLERCHRADFHCLFSVCCTTSGLRCLSEWKSGSSAVFGLSAGLDSWRYYELHRLLFNKSAANSGSKSLKNFCITWIMVCIALCVILLCQLLLRNQDQSGVIERSHNSLGMIEMSGFICGYVSCVFYLGSRFPQLYKNFRRRSTEGTSYLLFALAMMGNCTYGLSLVLRMPAAKAFQALYFLHHLPWLIGSFGVLFLDIFVTLQFILYRQQKERESGLVTLEVEPLLVNEETA
ncbi:uncharacterized protein LOC133222156 isoform X5 [Neopsephotus bourkii]|uniref:uncharacterized protein LOC133222156 isoform X5 n=1 Tax=Neopsephotus bourkii TaxID=309878 RepID=UPI002AA50683|nr:uncharacterized protein LOC133222156 isoform X5 [Neopsephotus bourkii]